ncbi:hypothetical protein GQ53DRAFT_418297 [Thozetella sp. PMI_491]|nr:hypothetical protein GQ53DRAFT_418297 [Thozetella sp. PMI_491]
MAAPALASDPHHNAPEPQLYSTLEVVDLANSEYAQKQVVMSEDWGVLPQALHPNAPPQSQYVPPGHQTYYDPTLEHSPGTTYGQPSPVATLRALPKPDSPGPQEHKDIEGDQPREKRRIFGLPPKTFWIIAALVVLGVIAAIVGGAVGGTLSTKRNNEATESNNQTSSNPNPSSLPVKNLLSSSQLAAVNWTDQDRNTHYAVFAQDSSNALLVSLWDSKNQTWKAVNVSSAIATTGNPINLKPGTPLTAVATGPPDYDFEMHVTFLTPSNIINTIVSKDMGGKSWELGDLMKVSEKSADDDSSLASVWHRCNTGPGCTGDIIIAYQKGGNLGLLNSSNWDTPETAGANLDAFQGTSLNFIMVAGSELRLYLKDLKQVLIELKRSPVGEWRQGYLPGGFTPRPGNTMYAAASFDNLNQTFVAATNTNGKLTGYVWNTQTWSSNELLTLTTKGAYQNFTAVAQHREQRLYAIADDAIQEYRWDTQDPTTLIYVSDLDVTPTEAKS